MKRRFTILTAALALLVSLAIPMGMWGQTRDTETFAFSDYTGQGGPSGTGSEYTMVKTDVSISDTKFYGNTSFVNLYAGGVSTITPASGVTITQIVLTATSSSYNGFQSSGTVTPSTGSISHNNTTVTWTGSANVAFTISHSKQIRWTSIEVAYTSSGQQPTTYTVTYDANGGTGTMTDSNSPYNAGATVTVLGNEFTRTDYEFDHWNTAADDSGTSYDEDDTFTINANTTLYAQWTENTTPGPGGNTQTLTFDLKSNPGDWPTTNSATLTNYIYTLDDVDYTFALKNVKCNSGYLMMTATAVLGLPAIEGYKLTKVVASNSSNCSTSVKVGISSSATQESYIAGGAIQTWSTTSSTYTYNLTATEPNTMYYLYVTNKNAQVLGLELTYEPDSSTPAPSISANNENITYDATSGSIAYTINNEPDPAGTLTASVPQNSWLTIGTVGATVPFTCTANPASAARTETVTLTYTYNTNETVTKEVTVTQAGNPNIVDLISDINATNTYYAIRGTVVAVNARGCVIGDGTGYINFYNGYTAPSVAINDVVTVSGSMTSYGHIYQFSNNSPNTATIATAETSNYDGTPAITVITEIPTSTYSSGLHLSDYFQFEGTLTKSSGYYYVSVGEGQINIAYPSTTQQNAMNALENKTVRVKGYFAGINSSNYFSVMMESIEEVASTEPFVIVTPATISAPFGGADGTLAITYDNLPDEFSFDYYFCDADGEELAEDPDWINAEINVEDDVYSVSYTIDANNGEARPAYFKVYTTVNEEEVYAIVTVNQAQHVIDYAVLPFVWEGGERSAFDALNGTSTYGVGDYTATQGIYRMKLDDNNDYILVKTDSQPGKVTIGVKMIGGASTSTITIQGSADGETFTDIETLTISGAQNAVLTLETTNTFAANVRYVKMLFTKGSNVGVGPITIAKPAASGYTLTIEGYGTGTGNWYLIASPINVNIDPVNAGMITDSYVSTNVTPENGTYDLYRFNQSAELEWENYRVRSFALESGKGYLYASKNGVTIQFAGTPYNSNGVIPLVYVEGKEFAGWNLVGNPFTTASTISLPYYKMNDGRTALTSEIEGGTIAAMEGVFVYAYDETTQQAISSVTFTASRSRGNSNASVNINVMHNGATIDNAIVRFDEGRQLPKYQLFKNSSKLYIPKNGKDYAIVSSEAQGEMPVNFKAEENGTYTLNIDTENVEMNYLHLIDNMTGMDVDLLQTPSYTFDATTNDFASRFRLVFSVNNVDGPSTGSGTFAFFSNGNWVVDNEGEATLQVIDVNGRIVSNETINGTVATSINATPGVYMLRLVNGNEVKTQKIVVR